MLLKLAQTSLGSFFSCSPHDAKFQLALGLVASTWSSHHASNKLLPSELASYIPWRCKYRHISLLWHPAEIFWQPSFPSDSVSYFYHSANWRPKLRHLCHCSYQLLDYYDCLHRWTTTLPVRRLLMMNAMMMRQHVVPALPSAWVSSTWWSGRYR